MTKRLRPGVVVIEKGADLRWWYEMDIRADGQIAHYETVWSSAPLIHAGLRIDCGSCWRARLREMKGAP